MSKQLYRSKENRVIGGVCGGFADYLDIDPVIIRLICVLLFFTKAIGFIAYIVCMIIIPEAPFGYKQKYDNPYGQDTDNKDYNNQDFNEEPKQQYTNNDYNTNNRDERNKVILGVALIGLGVFIFARKFFAWFDYVNFGGILLVLAGLYIIVNGRGNGSEKK